MDPNSIARARSADILAVAARYSTKHLVVFPDNRKSFEEWLKDHPEPSLAVRPRSGQPFDHVLHSPLLRNKRIIRNKPPFFRVIRLFRHPIALENGRQAAMGMASGWSLKEDLL
jgi:hypothetical protein